MAGRFGALFAALLLAVSGAVQAANINARSPSFADVSTAVASAAKGDTVIVPAGTASWTRTLVINKPITLIGQTTVSYTNETANDQTIILDDVSRSSNPPAPIIHVIVTAGDMSVEPTAPLFLLKGFTFRGSPKTPTGGKNGALMLAGRCPAVRVTQCHFDRLYQESFYTFGWLYGVMDNCLHDITQFGLIGTMGMATYNDAAFGDGSWAEDAHWGSHKFFFYEQNVVHGAGIANGSNMDGKRGARFVVRNCKLYDTAFIEPHGTEGDRDRGSRATEFYNNICNRSSSGPGNPGKLRSGNILFHDNRYTGQSLSNPWVGLAAFRTYVAFQPWELANGTNPWDGNDPHGIYATGTAAGASTVGGATSDCLVNVAGNLSAFGSGSYSITNTRTGLGSLIHSAVYNATTNRTLIACLYSNAWATAKVAFAAGDPFRIARVSRVLDQTGLGRGKLLSGSNPTATPLAGAVSEPSYAWNNTQTNGSKVIIHSEGATFVEGRDYFNSAPPFAYKPYTYPHPLVNAIAPPSNLQIAP